jgi:predicted phage terminase large subunit-like protein
MFRRHWFEVVSPGAVPAGLTWVRYWDLAQTTKQTGDFTVGTSVAFDANTGYVYVRDVIRGRWEWPDARAMMRAAFMAEPQTVECVEKAMHGLTALQEFARDAALLNKQIHGITVDRDKVSRAQAFAARASAGRVRLVQGPWIAEWLSEVCTFPQAAHDDQVDAAVGAFAVLAKQVPTAYGPEAPGGYDHGTPQPQSARESLAARLASRRREQAVGYEFR